VPQFSLVGPERGGELVLHAGEIPLTQDGAGQFDLLDAGVGDAGQPDLPGIEQFLERADRLRVGHLRVGPMELVQADHVCPQGLSEASTASRRYAGDPSSVQDPSPGRRWPPLVATSTLLVSPG
jgi:hypothetical protein